MLSGEWCRLKAERETVELTHADNPVYLKSYKEAGAEFANSDFLACLVTGCTVVSGIVDGNIGEVVGTCPYGETPAIPIDGPTGPDLSGDT